MSLKAVTLGCVCCWLAYFGVGVSLVLASEREMLVLLDEFVGPCVLWATAFLGVAWGAVGFRWLMEFMDG